MERPAALKTQVPARLWPLRIAGVGALAAATLVVSACGGSESPERRDPVGVAYPPYAGRATGAWEEVRKLPSATQDFDRRPASCASTHAVLITGGQVTPRTSRVPSRGCIIWGNKSGADVQLALHVVPRGTYLRGLDYGKGSTRASMTMSLFRSSSLQLGPLERLTPARAAIHEKRRAQRFCPSRTIGLGDPRTDTPVEFSYTIKPGGATGTIIVEPAKDATAEPAPARRLARDLRALTRLRCGAVLLEERPSACRRTKAVLIAGGVPTPSYLPLNAATSCVFWGNQDSRAHFVCADLRNYSGTYDDARAARCIAKAKSDLVFNDAFRIPPRTAMQLASYNFPGTTRRELRARNWYIIQPSGAMTTIDFG